MKTSQIKSLLIALLLALNIFLIGNIVVREQGKNIPSEESCENAAALLAERGVLTEPSVLRRASDNLPVLRADGAGAAALAAAQRMLPAEAAWTRLPDGSQTASAGGVTVTVTAEQQIIYQAAAAESRDRETSPGAARRAVLRFLRQAFGESDSFDVSAGEAGGEVLVTVCQRVGGYPLRGEPFRLIVVNGRVTYFAGTPFLGERETASTAQVRDAVNAAFQLAGTEAAAGRELLGMELGYVMGRGTDGSVMLIPAWFFELGGGELLSVDQLTGTAQRFELEI